LRRSAVRTRSGSIACPHGTETLSAALPAILLIECQRSENAPLVRLSTSEATVEMTALSMIRVELPVAIMASPEVRKTAGRRRPISS
jgi:hypothetical protein